MPTLMRSAGLIIMMMRSVEAGASVAFLRIVVIIMMMRTDDRAVAGVGWEENERTGPKAKLGSSSGSNTADVTHSLARASASLSCHHQP